MMGKIGLQTIPKGRILALAVTLSQGIIGGRPKQSTKAPNPPDYKNEFYPINQACSGQIKPQLSDISKPNW